MKISYNGQEIEAYSLVMTKENALAILNGKKDIETRMLSTKYEKCSRILRKLTRMRN